MKVAVTIVKKKKGEEKEACSFSDENEEKKKRGRKGRRGISTQINTQRNHHIITVIPKILIRNKTEAGTISKEDVEWWACIMRGRREGGVIIATP